MPRSPCLLNRQGAASNQQPDPKTGKLPCAGTFGTMRAVAAKEGVLALWNSFCVLLAVRRAHDDNVCFHRFAAQRVVKLV